MRWAQQWTALLLLGLLAFAAADEADADEEGDDSVYAEDASDDAIGDSEFVDLITLFPDFPDKRFTQGEFIDVLCGFTNTGDKSYNVTAIKGSLNSPFDYRMYIQNFTEMTPNAEVKKGDQGTLFYRFYPDPNLEPRDYVLTILVDYVDADKEEYRSVVFNSTVEVVESQSALDSRTFFGRFLMLSFAGLCAFAGNMLFNRFGKKKGRAAEAKKTGGGENEWLSGINVPRPAEGRSNSGKKKNK